MLKELHIRNFVVIDSLELEFEGGMVVFTGETGAGKSIIVDALGLILGGRADSKTVRSGCEQAEITATFDYCNQAAIVSLLKEQAIEADEFLIIRRVINADGRSRAYVNGSTATINFLKTLSSWLVEIHGQHAYQSLVKPELQRHILDQFASHENLIAKVQKNYEIWKSYQTELHTLQSGSTDRESELSLLQYQLEELDNIAPSADEIRTLEQELKRLESSDELRQTSSLAVEELGLGEQSSLDKMQQHQICLQELIQRDQRLQTITELLEGSSAQLSEAIDQLREYADSVDINPERIQEVDTRLSILHDLARKHKVSPDQLHSHWLELKQKLQKMHDGEAYYQALNDKLNDSLSNYYEAANHLSNSRSLVANKLALLIQKQIQQLGMDGTSFQIAMSSDKETDPKPHGLDRIEFLVAANPGQAAGSIAKVASGGELSRISLAISVIGKTSDSASTLIFDEVDSGIGGATAEIVGALLHRLAEQYQVYCVTHLPQVASFGRQHFKVTKLSSEQSTQTRVSCLDNESRVEEVARMLGGVEITEQSLAHAREMLTGKENAA